jgi:hypothetical protein
LKLFFKYDRKNGMAHFAKIGLNSRVLGVHVVNNSDMLNGDGVEDEEVGKQFLENIHGWPLWIKTSYNTLGGVHKLNGTPLRKNYAGIGMIWDEDKDMFYGKQPYVSWTLNEGTGQWDPPTPKPDDGKRYDWNESTLSWDEIV